MPAYMGYDVKARQKVPIQNPKAMQNKKGMWMVTGTSPKTGIKVFAMVGKTKPKI